MYCVIKATIYEEMGLSLKWCQVAWGFRGSRFGINSIGRNTNYHCNNEWKIFAKFVTITTSLISFFKLSIKSSAASL